MDEVTCPYCGKECKINHDDGAFYDEDKIEELECSHCDKIFMVSTYTIRNFEGHKCPCKNGEEHNWEDQKGYPTEIFEGKKRCSYCDEEKDFYTEEQRKDANKRLLQKHQ